MNGKIYDTFRRGAIMKYFANSTIIYTLANLWLIKVVVTGNDYICFCEFRIIKIFWKKSYRRKNEVLRMLLLIDY